MARSPAPALLALAFALLSLRGSSAQLSAGYYSSSCPDLLPTARSAIEGAIAREARMGASILRLFFHDCFVNGCDASLLLDDAPGVTSEKGANANANSARGFDVIDDIKAAVEKACPGVVSCADILAIAARDSVVALGGPSWDVKLGRRDSTAASVADANNNIPSPTASLGTLVSLFAAQGLSAADMVALAGAHTIGQARCTSFRSRIYNDADIESAFARLRQSTCPSAAGAGDGNLAPLDEQTPAAFDNNYYKNLLDLQGLLHSDQQLYSNGSSTAALVRSYAGDDGRFCADFAAAMVKMGDITPVTGAQGEVRKSCRAVN